MNKRPHICIVAADIWPILVDDRSHSIAGGLEVQLCILARAFVRAGYQVSVVTMDFGQPDGVQVDGIRVYRTHRPRAGFPLLRFFHPRISSWWLAMKKADADVYIQRSAAYLTAIVALFCRANSRTFIYSGASDLDFVASETWKLFQRRAGWRDQLMYKLGLRFADGIVAQHSRQVSDCLKWHKRQAVQIPNCYDGTASKVGARDGVILWVSTIKQGKRPELFLELARSLPQFTFRMVGGPGAEGDPTFETTRTAAELLSNVEFVGFVPYKLVASQFGEARLFVNTSEFEGFPNTFLQAWAHGIPTVSFVDCGANDLGRSIGYVCRDLSEMRLIIERLCRDDAEREAEGIRAHRYFLENHSVEKAVALYGELIGRLLKLKGTAQ